MKKSIQTKNRNLKRSPALLLATAVLAILATGCGQQAYNETTPTTVAGSVPTSTTTTTPAPTATLTPTTTASSTPSNATPNYNYHFEMTGSGSAAQVGGGALEVSTATTLQVTITTGNGLPMAGTGYTIGFDCEMFNIQVGNIEQTAFVKKSSYTDFMLQYGLMQYDPCANAQTSWTYDFSAALAPGHQNVTILVNDAQYDNCRLENDPYDGGCAMSTVYYDHPIDGFMSVTTDSVN